MEYKHIWFGLICGGIVNILVNVSLVLFLFYETFASLLPAILCCVLAAFLLKSDKWKSLGVSALFAFVGFIAVEILLSSVGVIMYFYRMKYSGATEMSLGFGLVAFMHHIVYLACFAIGTIIACILTAIKKKQSNANTA